MEKKKEKKRKVKNEQEILNRKKNRRRWIENCGWSFVKVIIEEWIFWEIQRDIFSPFNQTLKFKAEILFQRRTKKLKTLRL